ncbi:hypothetical protein TSUD_276580 [Trifolium subterraneum]|uniref:Uncharacterized protein n=1 Tax=Trifolium subterraneum TaxID=3900 RepID=A0A2Z6NPQ2_TRISU|nr:hypothetical protein TSUD_276580 [Trifolium subterraneum]
MELKGEAGVLSAEEVKAWKADCELLWQLLKSKDCLEFQKSKAKWLKEGDANTSFFHACVKGRRRTNAIVALNKGDVWLEDPNEVHSEEWVLFSERKLSSRYGTSGGGVSGFESNVEEFGSNEGSNFFLAINASSATN